MGFKFDFAMTTENIILNGYIYNQENIHELRITNLPQDSGHNAIYSFLQNWFDISDFIPAHTSGSTGTPKTIQLSKQSMINSARMTNHFFGLDAESSALLCLPASYIAGKMMLVRALVGGFNLVTVEPSANPFENLAEPIDFAAITPYQLFHSLESLLTSLVRKIIVGGSPVTSKLESMTQDIPAELYETYGMTETCSHIALRRFNGEEKSDYFTALEGVAIRPDERGCLVIHAPHLLEEEIITNDMVEMVGSNSFKWLGRIDSTINSGGIKIHPEQIERKLDSIIASNFFITSLPDELLDNKVVLVIESETYSSEQEEQLNIQLQGVLTRYEIPKQILYLSPFIYSAGNKVLRKQTLEQALKS